MVIVNPYFFLVFQIFAYFFHPSEALVKFHGETRDHIELRTSEEMVSETWTNFSVEKTVNDFLF